MGMWRHCFVTRRGEGLRERVLEEEFWNRRERERERKNSKWRNNVMESGDEKDRGRERGKQRRMCECVWEETEDLWKKK